jgi:hypothetical protein
VSRVRSGGLSRVEGCPVQVQAAGVVRASRELVVRMRRLRRVMLACRHCRDRERCDFQHAFNASIDAAIAEVTEEWGLGSG